MDELYIINLTYQCELIGTTTYQKYRHKKLYFCYINNSKSKLYVNLYDRHMKKNLGKSFVNQLIQELLEDSYCTEFSGSINCNKLIYIIQSYLGLFPINSINCIHIREIKIR